MVRSWKRKCVDASQPPGYLKDIGQTGLVFVMLRYIQGNLLEIWTVGHSSRDIRTFLDLLLARRIECIADIRRFPGSRAHPQFNQEALEQSAKIDGIGYRHFPLLGGRRSRVAADSPNTAWRVAAFNAYADYMASADFETGLEELISHASRQRTAMMCSEAVPWRCHRRLVSDALVARGWTVWEILGSQPVKPHVLTPFAKVEGSHITYPGGSLFP